MGRSALGLVCLSNERRLLNATGHVSRVGIVVEGDQELDGRSRALFLGTQNREPFGLHGDLEGRDLLGSRRFTVRDEPKGVAVEGIGRVFRGGDDEEAAQVPARIRET